LPGTSGQKLTSAGAGIQVSWATPTVTDTWVNNTFGITIDGVAAIPLVINLISADANNLAIAGSDGRVFVSGATVPNLFTFTSASNITHTITHNLGNQFPDVTVYDTATNQVVTPATVVGTSINVLTITFFSAVAIAGSVVG
jgi:hypothetical protein